MDLSPFPRHCKHDVFPSFHGEDVRRSLLAYLLKEFREKGIDVFIDNDIERSKSIGPELKEAIRRSTIAIVLISKNYASSTWCLDELVEIIKCRDEDSQMTMVVFYEVDPSDVKKQTGYFGDVFKKTCAEKTTEEVERWRLALQKVAKIAGYHSRKWDSDVDMIETIATDVSNKLNDSTASNDLEGLVGIEAHIMEVESLLSLESNEVRVVGIWGPAGIGKTTIARALYRKLSTKFTHTAFLESIRGKFEQKYQDNYAFMLHLQAQLLSNTLNQKDLKIDHLGVAEARLKKKKVLVVLDDVNELKQLEAMTNKPSWFGPGSRIIITTKDKKLLKAHEINHIYKVNFPSTSEALEILCLSAFRSNSPPSGFEDMAVEVARLAGNLPLGLSVFGTYLRGMEEDEWIHALPRFRTSLYGDIEKVLMFSYDALCDEDRQLFLHIACFFKGMCISDLVEYLAESRLHVIHGLQVLVDKSFISIHEERYLMIHNLLEQLGKEIVLKQSVSKPGKRKFLVDPREICDVLADNKGTESILGIDLDLSEIRREVIVDERAFEKMSSLQFLRVMGLNNNCKLILPQRLKFRASKLRFLQWEQYPLTFFPSEFQPQFLVKLEMQDSRLERLWEGPIPLPCLKWMDLSGSSNLKKIPNLSNATNLQKLHLHFCRKVRAIPSSIGNATNITTLDLFHCESLVELPSSIGNLKRLTDLSVAKCSKLDYRGLRMKRFPQISTNIGELDLSYTTLEEVPSSINSSSRIHTLKMSGCEGLKVFPDVPDTIQVLYLNGTGIEEVPQSIQNLSRLRILCMTSCKKLKVLPTKINLESLSSFYLGNCPRLKIFPEVSTSIEYLDLCNTAIEEVPPSIQNLSRLRELYMNSCKKLKVLPTKVNLESLSSLDLCYCTELKMFPEISTSIKYLDLSNTAIEEVPSSIWSWYRLVELNVEDCKSLQLFNSALDSVEEMDLSNTETESLIPSLCIKLKGCANLMSLPYLPDFVSILDAAGCESLERIEGYIPPKISLNFANCFKLNQEARKLILTSEFKLACLPGKELPACYVHRARGNSLTVNLDQGPLPTFLRFKACLLLRHGSYHCHEDDEVDRSTDAKMLSCRIWCIQNEIVTGYGSCKYYRPSLLGSTEHLYFFESSISLNFTETDVNFSELQFEFKINGEYWKIDGCGVQLLEDFDVHDESAEINIGKNLHGGRTRTDNNLR